MPTDDPALTPQQRAQLADLRARRLLDSHARRSRLIVLLAGAALVVMIAVAFLTGPDVSSTPEHVTGPAVTREGKPLGTHTIVVALGNDAKKLDPHGTDDIESGQINAGIYEGLVKFAPGMRALSEPPQPALAERWETSPDGLTWTFFIRHGVTFHDGEPLTPAAIKLSLDRVRGADATYRSTGFHMPYTFLFNTWPKNQDGSTGATPTSGISSIVADEQAFTVTITLIDANVAFLKNLAMSPASVVSPKALKREKAGGARVADKPVGTGPWRLKTWKRNELIVLERNPTYWGPKPAPARVQLLPIRDNETRLAKVLAGEADIMMNPAPAQIVAARDDPRVRLIMQPNPNVCYLVLNPNPKVPDIDDPSKLVDNPIAPKWLRRAITLGVDKQRVVRNCYADTAMPAVSLLPPTILGAPDWESDAVRTPARLEEARRLMREHGYGPGNPLHIPFAHMSESRPYLPDAQNLATELRLQLREIWIELDLRTYPWEQYKNEIRTAKYPFCIIGWVTDNGDPDNFLYVLMGPGNNDEPAALNAPKYKDIEVWQWLRDAQRTTDPQKRRALYVRAAERIRDAYVIVPLVHTQQAAIVRPNVRGFQLHPMSELDLDTVTLAAK